MAAEIFVFRYSRLFIKRKIDDSSRTDWFSLSDQFLDVECLFKGSDSGSRLLHEVIRANQQKKLYWSWAGYFPSLSLCTINSTDESHIKYCRPLWKHIVHLHTEYVVFLYFKYKVLCFVMFSLQFAVLMWILTYVGALFNGLTLLILGEEAVAYHFPSSFEALMTGGALL